MDFTERNVAWVSNESCSRFKGEGTVKHRAAVITSTLTNISDMKYIY